MKIKQGCELQNVLVQFLFAKPCAPQGFVYSVFVLVWSVADLIFKGPKELQIFGDHKISLTRSPRRILTKRSSTHF